MNSQIFDSMGLSGIDIGYIIIGMVVLILILFILYSIQIGKYNKLNKKYSKFMLGKDATSLEEETIKLFSDIDLLKKVSESNHKEIRKIYKKLETTYQKLGVVKYDAFKQMGGQLSFCIALLNEDNDGFIMNSVHSTDGCYSYTKVITRGESDIDLGNEEAKALKQAMGE